jgi:hypothetical protein
VQDRIRCLEMIYFFPTNLRGKNYIALSLKGGMLYSYYLEE